MNNKITYDATINKDFIKKLKSKLNAKICLNLKKNGNLLTIGIEELKNVSRSHVLVFRYEF